MPRSHRRDSSSTRDIIIAPSQSSAHATPLNSLCARAVISPSLRCCCLLLLLAEDDGEGAVRRVVEAGEKFHLILMDEHSAPPHHHHPPLPSSPTSYLQRSRNCDK